MVLLLAEGEYVENDLEQDTSAMITITKADVEDDSDEGTFEIVQNEEDGAVVATIEDIKSQIYGDANKAV